MILDLLGENVQPILMSSIIGYGIASRNINHIVTMRILMIVFTFISMIGGAGNSVQSAKAGIGFA